jgi:putative NIF3 family GTP cyclohydrolase 1 type 2
VVDKAIELNADTIVTHHPAIYNPIKKLSVDGENSAVLRAIRAGLNVVSMHLNLDMAKLGIDEYLSRCFFGDERRIINYLDDEHGYGREVTIEPVEHSDTVWIADAEEMLEEAKKDFRTDKILLYGKGSVKSVASFCGSGGDVAVKSLMSGKTSGQLIVTSDLPHHQLLPLIEAGRKVMIIPHYPAELYGFNKFYQWAKQELDGIAQLEFFEDKRFM